ncbi:cytidylyltransferase domain-containing protein [Pseudoalteromonas ostreae]|uniref:cytidylyltransferase domain-containing protein n=1 Tax=Pseudoalteromonas ostreae TaxID=2774154 RepID=UPI001B36C615|nr:glycosyltransferase family protein [Pseudoalteromonas ostreae]
MNKTIAFVQARMSSTRLPKKVLRKINGIPVIEHLICRLEKSAYIDEVVVLTSNNSANDQLVSFLERRKIAYFRGSENNVLSRFVDALNIYETDNVVRITGDSPFICPEICDALIKKFFDTGADYAYLDERFAEGVDCEVIKASILHNIDTLATLSSEREHVTLYLFNNPVGFKIELLENASDDSQFRFTLDTIEDWLAIEKIGKHFSDRSLDVNYQEIKTFIASNEDVFNLNKHIVRNEGLLISLEEERYAGE